MLYTKIILCIFNCKMVICKLSHQLKWNNFWQKLVIKIICVQRQHFIFPQQILKKSIFSEHSRFKFKSIQGSGSEKLNSSKFLASDVISFDISIKILFTSVVQCPISVAPSVPSVEINFVVKESFDLKIKGYTMFHLICLERCTHKYYYLLLPVSQKHTIFCK